MARSLEKLVDQNGAPMHTVRDNGMSSHAGRCSSEAKIGTLILVLDNRGNPLGMGLVTV